MQYKNTRRAALGAGAILLLGAIIYYRRGMPRGQGDYMLMGAALFLVLLNLGMSYYFDLRQHQREQQK